MLLQDLCTGVLGSIRLQLGRQPGGELQKVHSHPSIMVQSVGPSLRYAVFLPLHHDRLQLRLSSDELTRLLGLKASDPW